MSQVQPSATATPGAPVVPASTGASSDPTSPPAPFASSTSAPIIAADGILSGNATLISGSGNSTASQNSTPLPAIPANQPVAGITMTKPPQSSTSFFKIAPNEIVTFGWNYTYLIKHPENLTVSAICENGNTYPVGPSNGVIDGTATEVAWDLHSWQVNHPETPLAQGTYTLTMWDHRGSSARPEPGMIRPYNSLRFALYSPQPYTPLDSGWTCSDCRESAGILAASTHPSFIGFVVSALVIFLSGIHLLRSANAQQIAARLSTSSQTTTETGEPPTFTFPEEPLGLAADAGYGYFQGAPDDYVGPNDRFHLHAKLGFGTNSSVWLARDSQLDRYRDVALKILTGHASKLNTERLLRELAVHKRLASLPADETKYCTRLIVHFMHKGIEQDGEHLCLALELERATLDSVWNSQNVKFHPVPIVKRILRHVLHASPQAGQTKLSLPGYRIIPRAHTEFPPPSLKELEVCDFKVADLSNAQELDDQTTDHITPLTLRAPEVVLGGPWDEKVDIWTFGCLVFTILTKAHLFPSHIHPIHHSFLRSGVDPNNADGIEVDYLLWLMMVLTDQRFPPAVLALYQNSPNYFEPNGDMKRFESVARRPLEVCIRDTGCPASEEDIKGASELVRRCLKFNPSSRPSVQDLLQDPWLKDTDL
ncbi:hypothetical protein NP233_g886 [Leucocoprinus birnbaumii]|uniref:Protein kinase domain-containing protein n=1 Tax=Leucocoprinus birnbaumii TaxID=56174 RepID=A0AAD5YVD5_9AGAR|nr:hypothetical protein NP233_g886 [Leucocoprinus birnbaumii]